MKFILIVILAAFITSCKEQDGITPDPIPNNTSTQTDPAWTMRLSSINVWGLWVLSKYKEERMLAIGKSIESQQSDIATIQEAWTEQTRKDIFSNTTFTQEKYFPVSHTVGSGLYYLSRTPLQNNYLLPFIFGGRVTRPQEGEVLAGKGVSATTVDIRGLPVTVFNLHTVARQGSVQENTPSDVYTPERLMSVFEIFATIVEKSESDAFVVAGDFNINYKQTEYWFWRELTSLRGNEVEEFDHTTCTSCADNVFNGGVNNGQIDFVFASPKLKITKSELSFLEKIQAKDGKLVNLSDHYGWVVDLQVNDKPVANKSQEVRQKTSAAVDLLLLTLESYRGTYTPFFVNSSGIEDKICTPCLIEESIKKVKEYKTALENPNSERTRLLQKRLESYFSLFK